MHATRLQSLIKKLTHDDPSQRRAAAEALSDGDERAIYPLIKALKDENLGVQDAAMQSLMALRGESTAYMVLPLLRENAFLRNTAMVILKEIGRETVPLLKGLLNDTDDDIRKFALDLIHDIGWCDYPDIMVTLLESDRNPNVRASAARTLGMLQYKKSVPQLMQALNDEEWVTFSAIEGLAALHDESSVDAIAALLGSPGESIRFAAIEALGQIGSPNAGVSLMNHFEISEGLEKEASLISLVQVGSVPSLPGMAESLLKILMNREWDEKMIAIQGLLSIRDNTALRQIVDVAGSLDLSKPEDEHRLSTIKEAIRSYGCIDELFDILNDDTMRYRGKALAVEVIGDLRCTNAIPFLITLLNCDYRDVRRSSTESLSKLESKEAEEVFIRAIGDYDSHVRKNAVTALGKMGNSTAFEPLVDMLKKERYTDVIDEVVKALINIDAKLFLSKMNEFNSTVHETASRYVSDLNLEIPC